MATIATLLVKIAADTAELKTGMEAGFAAVESGVGKIEGLFKKAAAFSILGIGVKSAITDALAYADAIDHASHASGIGVEWVQKLTIAAQESGDSFEAVVTTINAMQQRIADAAPATEAAFTKVGLTIAQLRAMAPEQMFIAISDAIGRIPDPVDRAQAKMDLLGKSGAQLAVVGTNLRAIADEAERLGLVLTKEDIEIVDKAGDAWDRLGLKIKVTTSHLIAWLEKQREAKVAWESQIERQMDPSTGELLPPLSRPPPRTSKPMAPPTSFVDDQKALELVNLHLTTLQKQRELENLLRDERKEAADLYEQSLWNEFNLHVQIMEIVAKESEVSTAAAMRKIEMINRVNTAQMMENKRIGDKYGEPAKPMSKIDEIWKDIEKLKPGEGGFGDAIFGDAQMNAYKALNDEIIRAAQGQEEAKSATEAHAAAAEKLGAVYNLFGNDAVRSLTGIRQASDAVFESIGRTELKLIGGAAGFLGYSPPEKNRTESKDMFGAKWGGGAITFNTNVNGLVASDDPSGRENIRRMIDRALSDALKDARRSGSI